MLHYGNGYIDCTGVRPNPSGHLDKCPRKRFLLLFSRRLSPGASVLCHGSRDRCASISGHCNISGMLTSTIVFLVPQLSLGTTKKLPLQAHSKRFTLNIQV